VSRACWQWWPQREAIELARFNYALPVLRPSARIARVNAIAREEAKIAPSEMGGEVVYQEAAIG